MRAALAAPRAMAPCAGVLVGARVSVASRARLLARRASRPPRRVLAFAPRALDRDAGSDDSLNMNILAERMKALQAKEAGEAAATNDAEEEREQAIVAGIRGDAADRPVPEPGDFDGLIEHLLSTPMEAMDLESARCAPLLTSAFQAHCELRMREAAALGPAGEETAAELQLLTEWTRAAREAQADRDDAARRRRAMEANGGVLPTEASAEGDPSPGGGGGVSFPTPVRAVNRRMEALMAAAANGVDALRAEIVEMARVGETDDALLAVLDGNAAGAEEAGDEGRARFLRKIREVCVRERRRAGTGE